MKHGLGRSVLAVAALCVLVGGQAVAQPSPGNDGLFYFAGDEVVSLAPAERFMAVRLAPDESMPAFGEVLAELLEDRPWRIVERFPRYRTVLFEIDLEAGGTGEDLAALLSDRPEVEALTPVFFAGEERGLLVLTDQILVRFRPELSPEEIEEHAAAVGLEVVERDRYEEGLYLMRVVDAADRDALMVANRMHEDDLTLWAEPNFIARFEKLLKPNDKYFKDQWPLENTGQGGGTKGEDVGAVAAWDTTTGNENVVIAIIDDGVDYNHEDLKANIYRNPGEITGNKKDDDNNGFKDDIRGWDFFSNDNDPIPSTFNSPFDNQNFNDIHGTPCAGIAAARINNKLGVAGMAGTSKILPVKVFGGTSSSNFAALADVVKAIKYAGANANVLSGSWRYPSTSSSLSAAVKWAATKGRGGKGSPFLLASGNSGSSSVSYPANQPDAIAVGGSTNQAKRWSSSNYGSALDVLAPTGGGTQDIHTTDVSIANRGYDGLDTAGRYTDDFGGTSAATPLAAGVAALVLSVDPSLKATEVKKILEDTAEQIDATNANYNSTTGKSTKYGHGRVDAQAAVKKARDDRLKRADVYARDHSTDQGDTPTSGGWYKSVDIKVDGPKGGTQPATDFDKIQHEQAAAGQKNIVYVRTLNRGKKSAGSVTAHLYWAWSGAGLPQLPAQFWSQFPTAPSGSSKWTKIGQVSLGNVAAGGSAFKSIQWTAPKIDPTRKDPTHHCLLAILETTDDPVVVKLRNIGTIVRNDNNITLKNISVVDSKSGKSFAIDFNVANPTADNLASILRLDAPPAREQDWRIEVEGQPFDEPFVLEPEEVRLLTARVDTGMVSAVGEVTVIQERHDTGEVLGGVTFRFAAEPEVEEPELEIEVLSHPAEQELLLAQPSTPFSFEIRTRRRLERVDVEVVGEHTGTFFGLCSPEGEACEGEPPAYRFELSVPLFAGANQLIVRGIDEEGNEDEATTTLRVALAEAAAGVRPGFVQAVLGELILPAAPDPNSRETWDLLILSHAKPFGEDFESALLPLVHHKNNTGMPTILLLLDSTPGKTGIYKERDFRGRDHPEIIKKAIADAANRWRIKYVMLVGDSDRFPVRYTKTYDLGHWGHGFMPSDLYYADLFDANGAFDSWDKDGDDLFGEMQGNFPKSAQDLNQDQVHLLPDVAVGRVPASSRQEVVNYVQKVIAYETGADSSWFKKALLVTGDYPGSNATNDFIGTQLAGRGFQLDKQYHNQVWPTTTESQRWVMLEQRLDQGVGFLSYVGHGGGAGASKDGGQFGGWYRYFRIPQLANQGRLPVIFSAACDTGMFHYGHGPYWAKWGYEYETPIEPPLYRWAPEPISFSPETYDVDSLGEHFLVKGLQGGIAFVGAYTGTQGDSHTLAKNFFQAYAGGKEVLGDAWNEAISKFVTGVIDNQSFANSHSWYTAAQYHHIHKMLLFGDPSLRIGGLLPDLVPVPDKQFGFCRRRDGKLLVTVTNQGAAPAVASTTVVDFFEHGRSSAPTSALAAGQSEDLLFEIPTGCFDSDCEFEITIDSNSQVGEADESNNIGDGDCVG